ncbi:CD209 antigen-like protein E [Biomphalaria pfeifferi]|uniref:CD209 antigen-like protein E n=1 Tax=Biomphalaria pfeifferi TaxID=112525 RepID=A0AAD8C283_BIOPF|nr:CD209 antigen-like protein E [Biomphalaria pfeifferi]
MCVSRSKSYQNFLFDSVKKLCLGGADLGSAGIKPSSRDRLYSQSTQYCDVSLGYNSTIMRTHGLCLSQHPQKPFLQLTALVLACKANW